MDFFYHGNWRMDWGLGNPNKTAVLIACLMLAIWLVACYWRRGFWIALPLSTALGCCLVQTYSRGGMLAQLAGLVILLVWTPRPWPRARAIAGIAMLWMVVFFTIYAKAEMRYGQGLFSDDQSINSRLVVWKHFPEMFTSAPWGCGWGKAGDAYTQWFQSPDESVNYLNLLNSHFTWMAEGGWGFSLLYIMGWFAVILLCWPAQNWPMRAVPLAVWTVFGVGGFFSQVEDSFCVWVVPLLLLGLVIHWRMRRKSWPAWRQMGMSGLFSAAAILGMIITGYASMRLPIKIENQSVVIGRGASRTIIYIDREVMGKFYGHTLRKFLAKSGADLSGKTYIVTEMAEDEVPEDVSQIIVSGKMALEVRIPSNLRQIDPIILINPACFPEQMRWDAQVASRSRVCFGEYAQVASRSSWEADTGVQHLMIDGAGDFVPAWPSAIWKPAGT